MNSDDIDWIDGQPYSARFGDIYFSRHSGLDETRHVFLQGNDLAGRWGALASGASFVIGEIGFGTGLNFLAAWQLWRNLAPNARLHFFSCELFPMDLAELKRAHALWPEMAGESDGLCAQYGPLSAGWHRFVFDDGTVTLTLVVGDARECLPRFQGFADAWFLDGFAPAKNPELWQPDVLRQVGAHSRAGATLATYTSAGQVRRDLQAAGFVMDKRRGHGRKREMLVGRFAGDHENSQPVRLPGRALVVGAGVAGCASARALAQRGWVVDLIEQGTSLASGASALPQASLHPRLARRPLPSHQLGLTGYQYSIRLMRWLLDDWSACGTLQVDAASRRPVDAQLLADYALPQTMARRLSRAEASDLAGVQVSSDATFFPLGGWVHGASYCAALSRHSLIQVHAGTSVRRIERSSRLHEWRIATGAGGLFEADLVVLANAFDAGSFPLIQGLPLSRVGGQITLLPASVASNSLRVVLCGEGILMPAFGGRHSLGATYNHSRSDLTPSSAENADNWVALSKMAPGFELALGSVALASAQAFVAFRTTAPDRTPIAGSVPSAPGLVLNLAHGSRGFSTAPLLAEYLASHLAGDPLPLPVELGNAVDPARFLSTR